MGEDLRPLTGRALKSIVDTLRIEFPDSRVLDLYSGNGRFGIAALEAGAKELAFVEKDRVAAAKLRQLSTEGGASKTYQEDVLSFLPRAANQSMAYDIVFADPPFRLWTESYASQLVSLIPPVMRPSAIFLVRYPKKVLACVTVEGLTHWKKTDFGESEIAYFSAP